MTKRFVFHCNLRWNIKNLRYILGLGNLSVDNQWRVKVLMQMESVIVMYIFVLCMSDKIILSGINITYLENQGCQMITIAWKLSGIQSDDT